MIPWVMNLAQKGGVPFRVWKKFYFQLSACWLVSANSFDLFLKFNSCLIEPNDESGANIDAAKMWRDNRAEFDRIATRIVRKSLNIPL